MKRFHFLFLLVPSLFAFQCHPTTIEPIDRFTLSGDWQEIESAGFGGQIHQISFRCDSFYMQIDSYTDVVVLGASCGRDSAQWTEYTLGTWSADNQSIAFNGVFANADFSSLTDTCSRSGPYEVVFDVGYFADDSIAMETGDARLGGLIQMQRLRTEDCPN
ncbi:MAG: hypothetical protein AAF206_18000 [Bacteroidota bacterium]